MTNSHWRIEGYQGSKLCERYETPSPLSDAEIIIVLQRLASRDLTFEEIASASKKEGSPGYSSVLEPKLDAGPPRMISIGEDPHYIASIIGVH